MKKPEASVPAKARTSVLVLGTIKQSRHMWTQPTSFAIIVQYSGVAAANIESGGAGTPLIHFLLHTLA